MRPAAGSGVDQAARPGQDGSAPDADLSAALDLAFTLAQRGPIYGPNPRVGCVIVDAAGQVAGQGWHRGAGQAHAEIEALADAATGRRSVAGGTAVVTLEPCAHQGRTAPCAVALVSAGLARVAFAASDLNSVAAGGADYLRQHGVVVWPDLAVDRAASLNRTWTHAVTAGRPYVTLKIAASLDGCIAAADGSSQWISSAQARAHAHAVRAEVDAIVVGTGTVWADDPALTARSNDGQLAKHQPLRVVMGQRDLPSGAKLLGVGGELIHVRSHDPAAVLAELTGREVRHCLIEGGSKVATAFLAAGLVDQLQAYIEPLFLGQTGRSCVNDLGILTLSQADRWRTEITEQLGSTVLIQATRRENR